MIYQVKLLKYQIVMNLYTGGVKMFKKVFGHIGSFFRSNWRKGQGLIEYVLIIAIIAIVVAAFLPNVAGAIIGVFDAVINALGMGGIQ
jgi:Class III signal peptide.